MCIVKFLLKLSLRILLIPVWIVLAIVLLFVMAVVRITGMVKGFLSFLLMIILVGTLIWYRTEWTRYVIVAISEGILVGILLAGIIVEELLSAVTADVGEIILFGF